MVGNLYRAGQNGGFRSFLLPAQADGLPERVLDAVLAEQRRDWIAGKRIPADERLRQHPELADEPACAAELIVDRFLTLFAQMLDRFQTLLKCRRVARRSRRREERAKFSTEGGT